MGYVIGMFVVVTMIGVGLGVVFALFGGGTRPTDTAGR